MSLNSVCLVGRLGVDPELRRTGSGKAVCTLKVATPRWKREGEQEEVDWHRVVAWEQTAERCQTYLKKGEMVVVEGRLVNRSWTEADGRKHVTTEIVATRVGFMGGGARQTDSEGRREDRGASGRPGPMLSEEALPF
jgi:single-strand DNA-binding protein